MKNRLTKNMFSRFSRKIALSALLFELFWSISTKKALAAVNGLEKLDVDLNYFLTGRKGGSISNMANADLKYIPEIILRVTNYAIGLGGVIAFVMILYSSIMYATSFGDESRAEIAKKAFTWSIIGMAVVIMFGVIMRLINAILSMGT